MPTWTPSSLEEVLRTKLSASEQSTPMLAVHDARPAQGPFGSISLRLPTSEAKTRDARVVMEVAEGVALKRAEVDVSYGASTPFQISSPGGGAHFVTHQYQLRGEHLFLRCDPDGDQRVSSVVLCRGVCD